MLGRLSTTLFSLLLVAAMSTPAAAQVFKYKKKDGSLVYTDSLSKLPADRRAYYNKLLRERADRQRKIEKSVGKQQYNQDKMEKERTALLAAKIEEEERARRVAAIDVQLKAIRERRAIEKQSRQAWTDRINTAKTTLTKSLDKFRKAQETYNRIAIKGGYGLLPGQAEKMTKAKKEMDELEVEIDAANLELSETIPEDARRAGVPPGWLR